MASKQHPSKQSKASSGESMLPFVKVEQWLKGNSATITYWCIGIGVLFALLMFNARILETDDANHIEGGYNYAKNFFGYYFTFQAPLYVMFLALPISLFGMQLIPLKLFSTLFYALGLYFFYRSLNGRVRNIIVLPALCITALNPVILSYASLTFTESFYMMLQALFFLVLANHLENEQVEQENWKAASKSWLGVGVMLILLSLTRNIAVSAVGGLVVYFFIQKKYKSSVIVVAVYAALFGLVEIIKKALWGEIAASQYGGQTSNIFLKNTYDPSAGTETFGGFIERFLVNPQIFFSSRFLEMLGLRGENSEPNILLTIIVVGLILFGAYRMLKNREKILLAMALYSIVMCAAMFLALQTSWGQVRYIMIHLPLFLVTIFYGLYDLNKRTNNSLYRLTFVVITVGLIVLNFVDSAKAASTNFPILQKNLQGDIYYGYPDAWASYTRLSRWCADSLGSEAQIACRKPAVSFIYGRGKSFPGIYNVPSTDPDTLLQLLKNAGATHIILDAIAGTVYRYMTTIEQRYPGTFEAIRQEGRNQTAAVLFKINYRK